MVKHIADAIATNLKSKVGDYDVSNDAVSTKIAKRSLRI
jgi:hypothetical protein